jgi:hypothetical protein
MRFASYEEYLKALKRWFHQGQTPGEAYRPEPIYHSLGGRGGPHDANDNRIDAKGRVIGYDAAFYGTANTVNPYTRKPMGAWLR